MTETSKLSVIVPIYNSERFLIRCIDSILNQTYHNLEILLIDDGSTDRSASICSDYAAKHPCIKYIRLMNGGASKSRNVGLKLSTGKFVTFVDSDDYLESDIYNDAMSAFKADIDIVSFGVKTVSTVGKILSEECYCDNIYDPKAIVKNIIANLKTAVWNKIFRRSAIKGIAFPEELTHNEDMVFFCRCVHCNTRLRTIPTIGYNYVKHNGSVTARPFTIKSLDEITAKDLSSDIISEKFPDLSEYMMPVRIRGRLNILRQLSKLKTHDYNKERADIKNWLKQNVKLRALGCSLALYYIISMNDWLIKRF